MPSTQSSIDFVETNENETLEYNLTVSYTMEPYSPQTWDEPASGGGPIDVSFVLDSVRPIRDPSKPRDEISRSRLNPRWVARIESEIDRRYDNDAQFRDRVQTAICDEEGERARDCRW